MSFTFNTKPLSDDSEAIAVLNKKTNKKGEMIYLNKSDENDYDDVNDKMDLFYEFAKSKRLNQRHYDEILDAIEDNEPPEDSKLRKVYNEFKAYHKKSNEIVLKEGNIEVVPLIGNEDTRQCILINGSNGVGKSYWAGAYAKRWQALFPQSPIYLLSNKPLKDEPAFKSLRRIKVIPLTKQALTEIIGENNLDKKTLKKRTDDSDSSDEPSAKGYSPHEYFKSKTGQSLVIVDDFESTDIEKLVRIVINSITSVGRSSRIYCLIISHLLCNGKATKMVLSEVDAYCLFIQGISPYHLKYCLKNYTKMNEQQISKVCDSNSRWVFINKRPAYVVEERRLWCY